MDGEAVAKALTDGEMSMSRREADQVKILTIILTHNSPKQLHAFFGRMQDRAAEFFIRSRVLVLNQSDLAGLQEDYDRICRKYGAQHICKANRGASGGQTVYQVTGTGAEPWKTITMRNSEDFEWMQDRMPYQYK